MASVPRQNVLLSQKKDYPKDESKYYDEIILNMILRKIKINDFLISE